MPQERQRDFGDFYLPLLDREHKEGPRVRKKREDQNPGSRKKRTLGPSALIPPRPVVLRADVPRPGHEPEGVLEGPRDMARATLGRVKRRVGKARYKPLGIRDDVKWLNEHARVRVHLRHESTAHGPSPLVWIVVCEPRVDWVLRIRAREAKVLHGGGQKRM